MLLYSVIRSGRVHTVQYNNSNPFINRKLQEVRDRLNQLRDLIGHYQVGKKLMVYSVNIHQAVFEKETFASVFHWKIVLLEKGQHFSDLNACFDSQTSVTVSYNWNEFE